MNLKKEININKKFIIIFILLNLIITGMYSSYALFEMSVIKNSVVVIRTASIDIITEIEGYTNPTITLAKGSSTTLKVNLTNDLKRDIAYKMYYNLTSGSNTFTVKTDEDFETNKVEGVMNTSRSINLIFTNTGTSSITLTLGTKGGVKGFEVELDQGVEIPITPRELVAGDVFSKNVKDLVNNTTSATYKSDDTKITYLGFYEKRLPEGYTEETLKALPNVPVSLDNKVKAYNDNGKVYIYSNNDIILNASMYSMFRGMKSLTKIDLEDLDTSNVTRMESTFSGCSSLTSLDVSNFNTSKVTNMKTMFDNCSALKELDVKNFNTSNVTTMGGMFGSCSSLTSLDVSNFNTAKVTDFGSMFIFCSSLTSLDVSKFNTAKVTSMSSMFRGLKGLTSLDVSNFNTANVTNMYQMFAQSSNLTSLDLTSFNTAKVTTTAEMFTGCSKLKTIDLSSFNTAKVTNMSYMFNMNINLTTVYVSNLWTTAAVTSSTGIFGSCTSIIGGSGTTYNNIDYIDKTYARIDGGTSSPGYFTYKEYSSSN